MQNNLNGAPAGDSSRGSKTVGRGALKTGTAGPGSNPEPAALFSDRHSGQARDGGGWETISLSSAAIVAALSGGQRSCRTDEAGQVWIGFPKVDPVEARGAVRAALLGFLSVDLMKLVHCTRMIERQRIQGWMAFRRSRTP